MRVSFLLVCVFIGVNSVRAETLSDADRKKFLENLETLRQTAKSKVDSKFRVALAAYREAMASDAAAIDLYCNCVEKVNFLDQEKKSADFRDWKRKEMEKFSDPGYGLALRQQLRWFVLTIQASSEKADRAKLAAEAQLIVDSIFRDYEKLRGNATILNQSVTSTVFARAYEIQDIKVEKWPLSPTQLESIYESILLPPLRNSSRLSELRATWIKRIQQEGTKIEQDAKPEKKSRDDKNDKNDKNDKKSNSESGTDSQAYEKFLNETLPRLQWNMEVDLYRSGDQNGAAARMMNHIEKYIAHPSAREWAKQFEVLLTPVAFVTPGEPEKPVTPEQPAE